VCVLSREEAAGRVVLQPRRRAGQPLLGLGDAAKEPTAGVGREVLGTAGLPVTAVRLHPLRSSLRS